MESKSYKRFEQMSTIPTAKELIRRRKNKAKNNVKDTVSKELERLEESGDLTGSIQFKDRDSALKALDILTSKGYTEYVKIHSIGGCEHSGCEDCGYESDRDNQNCVHFTGDCECLVWWEVRISLPDPDSDSPSDSDSQSDSD